MSFLYRGVSKEIDMKLKGLLTPKGNLSKVSPRYDGRWRYDGTMSYGVTEDNTVRAHRAESGLYEGCFISTTISKEKAAYFATSNYTEEGWIYVIDQNRFEACGVISKEFQNPTYPNEREVSIRASNCASILMNVILEKYEVDTKRRKKPSQ